MKRWLGWAAFFAAVLVVLLVALRGNPDAPDNLPDTVTTRTSAPPTAEAPSEPPSTEDAYSRAITDAAFATYTDDEKATVCGALIVNGPDAYASAVADNPNLSDVDPDVAADELTRLCNT